MGKLMPVSLANMTGKNLTKGCFWLQLKNSYCNFVLLEFLDSVFLKRDSDKLYNTVAYTFLQNASRFCKTNTYIISLNMHVNSCDCDFVLQRTAVLKGGTKYRINTTGMNTQLWI